MINKDEYQINVNDVVYAYSGKPYRCAGKYYYQESTREYASKSRGYKVRNDEINQRMVNKIVKKINECLSVDNSSVSVLNNCIFDVILDNNRCYTVFLKR